jgi:hypothetical protein
MSGYLKDHSAYYRGENLIYSLQREIASAGGNEAEYNLLLHLMSNPITLTKKEAKTIYIKDQVSSSCCLFLLPPRIQAILSILFHEYENWIAKSMASKYPNYKSNLNILSPYQILKLNTDILRLPISATVASFLSNSTEYSNIQMLDAIFDFNLDILKPTYKITNIIQSDFQPADIAKSVFDYYNYSNSFTEDFVSIIKTGNKLKALYYICASLKYSSVVTKGLVSILELWELDNQ